MTTISTPLVAIVTPVYNGARFLADAMESVQAQTYANLVHVVLDNASTDSTPEIIRRYLNARVPVVVARNAELLDMPDNWNKAVAMAPADASYFRVLCADDAMHPDFVSKTVALAERYPSVVAVGCGLEHRGVVMDFGWEPLREHFPGREAIRRFFSRTGNIIAHQVLFRREVLAWRQPFFEHGMSANDTDACLDVLRHGDWGFVHDVLAVTRDHPETDTNTSVKPLQLEMCEHLVLLRRFAEAGFGTKEGAREVASYRRYYFRKLVRWLLAADSARAERHIELLQNFGMKPTPLDFIDAVVDWPLVRVGVRRAWDGR